MPGFTLKISFSVALLLNSPGSFLPAEEEAVIEEDTEQPAGTDGIVFLSSGERLRGRVSVTDGKTLRIYDLRNRRTYSLALEKIEAIRTLVEEEKVEEAWTFEEGGSRRKVKLGWTYPVRNYRQEIQLAGGQVIEGHCHAAVLYVQYSDRVTRVIVPRQQKGQKGETLDDLVYPASIQLGPASGRTVSGAKEARAFSSLKGKIPGLQAITLVDRRSCMGYPGKVRTDGSFEAAGLLPGDYFVFLRTEDAIRIGLPAKSTLPEADLDAIRARVARIAEFFDSKRILTAGGPKDCPWVLLELERKGETTLADEGGRSFAVKRWELWAFDRRGEEWKISSRVFLDRALLPPGRSPPSAKLVAEPRLERVSIAEGENALE